MSEERFTNREIDLKFEVIKTLLEQISKDVKKAQIDNEKRFENFEIELKMIKEDVDGLKTFKTRTLAYWSIGVTIVTIALNKFL